MGNLANFATALITTAPTPATTGTSFVVEAAKGARFPAVPFYGTAHPKNEVPTLDNAEAVLVTARSTDTMTITRAQKGTTAKTILGGNDWRFSNTIFTEDMFNGSVVENEIPGGSVNGSNTAFTIATAGKVTGTLKVYKNGIRLKAGGEDFTETATGFTMVAAPATGTVLLADYRVGGVSDYSVGTNSTISDEAVTGAVNGSNTSYTTARAYIAGSLDVYINGLKQIRTTDYTETTPGSGVFTMIAAPLTGDIIRVNYQFNLNSSSNADTVDGIHASTTATANQLYPLGANARFPIEVLDTGLSKATVATSESSGSTSYVQLTTTTDTVTVTVGSKGIVLVIISSSMTQANQNAIVSTSFAVSGANTIAANDATCLAFTAYTNSVNMVLSGIYPLTGLTPGSTTFGMRYKVTGAPASGTWANRSITVIPL